MVRAMRLLAGLAAIFTASAGLAVLPSTLPEPAPAVHAAPEPQIEAATPDNADETIARRIKGIFAAVPALEQVTVTVREGVVELGGRVPAEEDIARAESIASRVAGVVTVENGVRRDVSMDSTISSLGRLSKQASELLKMLPLIGLALAVGALVAAAGYGLASLSGIWKRLTPNSFLAELIASAIRFVFAIGGVVIALEMIGASALLGAVLGGAGVIGIALGFALRDTIENYVASIMLSVRQPFRGNDWVVIDSHEGRVIRLTSRATILMTLDGNHLRIPNGTVFKAVILNYTRNPQRRFEFDLGIDAEDDPDAARELGVSVLAGLNFILEDPAPAARLVDVGDSNIVIRFLGWIDQNETDWYKARSTAIPAVKAALEDAGFALPEPIYRLRFDNPPTAASALASAGQATSSTTRKAASPPKPALDSAALDVRPDEEIAGMVERERKARGREDNDLLDTRRPVE